MVQKALTYKATIHRLKPMFFSQLTLLSNNLVLTSYLRGILLKIVIFFAMGRSAENIEETKKTDRRKSLKSKEKEKRRMQAKSNNNNIHLWF